MPYEEKSEQRKIRHLLNDKLCGCGSGNQWDVMYRLLLRAETHDASFYDPMGDIPANAVEFMAHVLDSWRLTEHGGGIGYSWLTPEGKDMLEFLKTYGTDTDTWPEWWCSCSIDEEW